MKLRRVDECTPARHARSARPISTTCGCAQNSAHVLDAGHPRSLIVLASARPLQHAAPHRALRAFAPLRRADPHPHARRRRPRRSSTRPATSTRSGRRTSSSSHCPTATRSSRRWAACTTPGMDWHFDIQHVAAQVRLVRKLTPGREHRRRRASRRTRRAGPRGGRRGRTTPRASARSSTRSPPPSRASRVRITLTCHSGGGSFLFGFIDGGDAIPADRHAHRLARRQLRLRRPRKTSRRQAARLAQGRRRPPPRRHRVRRPQHHAQRQESRQRHRRHVPRRRTACSTASRPTCRSSNPRHGDFDRLPALDGRITFLDPPQPRGEDPAHGARRAQRPDRSAHARHAAARANGAASSGAIARTRRSSSPRRPPPPTRSPRRGRRPGHPAAPRRRARRQGVRRVDRRPAAQGPRGRRSCRRSCAATCREFLRNARARDAQVRRPHLRRAR